MIRGIECTLSPRGLANLLMYFRQDSSKFFVPWCLVHQTGLVEQISIPETREYRNITLTACEMDAVIGMSIWELVLHKYPDEKQVQAIDSYEDFVNSDCELCLLYYDCGPLEIYIKDANCIQSIWNRLVSLNAQDLKLITDTNDNRSFLYV